MRRFILTGAPGSGKTTLLRYLGKLGYSVVEEAATDIIAMEQQRGVEEPWTDASFSEKILNLQRQRQTEAIASSADVQFFDRAPLDTVALCRYLDYPISASLLMQFKEAQEVGGYERDVFFIENLGFCEPSAARKISFAEALRFEKIHEDIYAEWGYHCHRIPPGLVPERASTILTRLT
jgi:predicted ATPase